MAKKKSQVKSFGIGAATALAALGAYFLYGTKEGRARRAKIRGWTMKLKGEVLAEAEKLKEINEDAYHAIVENVTKRYKAMKSVDNKELEKVKKELKNHWRDLKKRFKK